MLKNKLKTSIKFINHASVIVSGENISVLSDPWYAGEIFHKGWNLLYETPNEDIEKFLKNITHIWISHEHPDHFSIPFFKQFFENIKNNSIKIIFQKTKDKRVYKFLVGLGLEVQELEFNKKYNLSNNYSVTCIKDGFYDSGLLINNCNEKILNLNDCDITTLNKANEVYAITGKVDVLLTQFSFAAWKGGKENKKWRKEAAFEKIKTIHMQIEKFQPEYVIPFASYIYFSNEENFYLNDAVNRPDQLKEKLSENALKLIIMSPNDVFGGSHQSLNEKQALRFWSEKYEGIISKKLNRYLIIELETLQHNFNLYCERILKKNNLILIKVIRTLSPISVFKPITIRLTDLDLSIKLDYVNKNFSKTIDPAMLSMKSESLDFIFKNSFGFDTLTVNGCFEEEQKSGFVKATKSLAIENLNNLGIKIELETLFNFSIIKLFLTRLFRVARKLDS